MRYREIMTETCILKVQVWDGIIHVIQNPTQPEFEKFADERGNNLRGLLSYNGKDVYLWDASTAVHTSIIEGLSLQHVNCIRYKNSQWHGPDLFDENTGLYQEAIQRITPRQKSKSDVRDDELLRRLFDELP